MLPETSPQSCCFAGAALSLVAGQFGGRCGGIGGNTGECCRLGDRVEPFPVGTTDRVKALGGTGSGSRRCRRCRGRGRSGCGRGNQGSRVGTHQGDSGGRRPALPAGTIGVHTFDHWSGRPRYRTEPGKPGQPGRQQDRTRQRGERSEIDQWVQHQVGEKREDWTGHERDEPVQHLGDEVAERPRQQLNSQIAQRLQEILE
ncbi:Uncharacterised protein [Mycobacterium tuberculosis]|nr:Uncharacterised protein [Mycobacterium tuberculosis]